MGNKCGCGTKKSSELSVYEDQHRFDQENAGPNVRISENG